jgi:hypothetical protein
MISPEELKRRDEQTIAFHKNRLDLALAHQKEMTALFFKVTIGYFAILYGVFLIYKILYDTHFKDVDLFLYLVLFLFSVTFLHWAHLPFIALCRLEARINNDQASLDRELHRSTQRISIPPDWTTKQWTQLQTSLKVEEEYREITFEHNSQFVLLILGINIIIVPMVLCIYTFLKMPQTHIYWRGGCMIFAACLTTLSVIVAFLERRRFNQIQKKLSDLANEDNS